MRSVVFSILTLLVSICVTRPVHAFDQNQFYLLVQEYQRVCGQMIATPIAFHEDPNGSFAIVGAAELNSTDDLSYVDYHVQTPLQNSNLTRLYGLVSVRVDEQIEQSCQVLDIAGASLDDAQVVQLANSIRQLFESSSDFTISGGKYEIDGPPAFFFAVTGLFAGENIVSQISLDANEVSIEHIHLSPID